MKIPESVIEAAWSALEIGDHGARVEDALTAALAEWERLGMVLVRKEPTEAMIEAGWIDKEDVNPDDIYCAMIAAGEEK